MPISTQTLHKILSSLSPLLDTDDPTPPDDLTIMLDTAAIFCALEAAIQIHNTLTSQDQLKEDYTKYIIAISLGLMFITLPSIAFQDIPEPEEIKKNSLGVINTLLIPLLNNPTKVAEISKTIRSAINYIDIYSQGGPQQGRPRDPLN